MSLRVRETNVDAPNQMQWFRGDSNTTDRLSAAHVGLSSWDYNSWVVEQKLERSTIKDDDSQPKARDVFKEVDHVINRGVIMRANDCTISYNPPTPSCYFKALGHSQLLNAFPAPTLTGEDWGSSIAEMVSKLDGSINEGCLALVTLRELGKTIKMVQNPFNLLRPDWKTTAKLHTGFDLARQGANIWLEGQYGWKAALLDIRNFAKAYHKVANISDGPAQEDPRFSVQTSETATWANDGVFYDSSKASFELHLQQLQSGGIDYTISSYADRKITLKGYALSRLSARQNLQLARVMTRFQMIQNALGLDLAHLPTTLWESVPYSFVVDWFINWQRLLGWTKIGRLYERDVYNIGTSTKVTVTYGIQQLYPAGYLNYYSPTSTWRYRRPLAFSNPPCLYGEGSKTYYVRKPGVPLMDDIVSGFMTLGLSPLRMASGASLLLQKILS